MIMIDEKEALEGAKKLVEGQEPPKRRRGRPKGSKNKPKPTDINKLLEIPAFLRRKPEKIKPPKEEDSWQAAKRRASRIAEDCRQATETARLEVNAAQLEEYHKQKKYFDEVNDYLYSKEARENNIAGKITSEEKKIYKIYMRCDVTPEKMAKEILRQRLLNG